MAKNAKRFLLALGFALLLPGAAGAAGFGSVEHSFWEDWANPAALAARLWESLGGLTGAWTHGGSVDPNGETTDAGGSIDPWGGAADSGGAVDPNG